MVGAVRVVEVGAEAAAHLAVVDAASFAEPWSTAAIQGLLEGGLTRAWLARDTADAVLGAAMLRVVAGEGEFLRIAVRPATRRHGVAHAMLREILSAVADACPHGVHLEVRASNLAARHLYARHGFADQGRRRDYYQAPSEDAVLMHWRLAPAPAERSPGG